MQINDEERAMLAGELGEVRRWAMQHMLRVGRFFDAEQTVAVAQAHIMADTESLGEAGVAFLEQLASHPQDERQVRVPTITDPRGIDFAHYRRLVYQAQTEDPALDARARDCADRLGLRYERHFTGYGDLANALSTAVGR